MSMHAVAAIATDLDAIGRYTAPTPALQRPAASTHRIAWNRRESGDGTFDDNLVRIAVIAGQHDGTIATEKFTHWVFL